MFAISKALFGVIEVSVSWIVSAIVFLLLGGAVLGLVWFLIGYAEQSFGGPPMFYKVIRFVFIFLVVLLLIGLLLHLMGASFINVHV